MTNTTPALRRIRPGNGIGGHRRNARDQGLLRTGLTRRAHGGMFAVELLREPEIRPRKRPVREL